MLSMACAVPLSLFGVTLMSVLVFACLCMHVNYVTCTICVTQLEAIVSGRCVLRVPNATVCHWLAARLVRTMYGSCLRMWYARVVDAVSQLEGIQPLWV